jgi:hypothetical protein
MRKKTTPLPPNPFAGKNPEEVFKDLLSRSVPISREEAMERMTSASKAQMRKKEKR